MLPPSPSLASVASVRSTAMRPTILAVDDDEETLELLNGQLQRAGYTLLACDSAESALSEPRLDEVDVVVSDLHLGGMDGIGLCEELAMRCPGVPVVVVTAFASMATERAAFAAGAFDFVPKLFDTAARFLRAVERAAAHRKRQLDDLGRLVTMSGEETLDATAMKRLYSSICEAAANTAPVSIIGGSAAMRRAVARAIHEASSLRRRPFTEYDGGSSATEAMRADSGTGPPKPSMPCALGSVFFNDVDRAPLVVQRALACAVNDEPNEINAREALTTFRIIAGSAVPLADAVNAGRFSEKLSCRLAERCIALSVH
jgi:two-component system, NtrC family, response regulator GlrR